MGPNRHLFRLGPRTSDMHSKAVRTRTATTGTHTHDTIDHDTPAPPTTNNSTAVGEPTPFPPSNHDPIPAVQRLGLDSDSATVPKPTYADQASCPLSAPYTAPRPEKVSSIAPHRACLKVSGYKVIGRARGGLGANFSASRSKAIRLVPNLELDN